MVFLLAGSFLAQAPIKIGVVGPLTGAAAFYGDMVKGGATMYADKINAEGGINGRMIQLVFGDDMGDPREATGVAHLFSADRDICVVVGGYHSSNTFAAQPIYRLAKMPHITPGNTHWEIGWRSEWTFRNIFHDEFHIGQLADFLIYVLDLQSIAIIYDLVDPTTAHMETVKRHFEAYGRDVVAIHGYPVGTTDFVPVLLDIKGKNPEAIFAASYYAEAGLIAKQARDLGMDQLIVGGEALMTDSYIEIAGRASEGTVSAAPFLFDPETSPPEVIAWGEEFQQRWGIAPHWLAANTYDAMGIAIKAIMEVGPDRSAIRDYLADLTSLDKAFVGITGPNYFDSLGDSAKPNVFVVVEDGKFRIHPLAEGWEPPPLPREGIVWPPRD